MFLVPNYTTTEAIQEDENTATYRGYRNDEQQRVIIKLLKAEYPTSTNIALFERDYQITKRLRSAKILKVHHLEKYNNRVALIFEDFAGKPLQQYLKDKPIEISDFLIIAIKITESLATVHSNNIIHKNLSTQAIWINTLEQIKLTNFSVASLISDKHKTNYLAENLSYISPEQTGRINRVVNFRTDFYSLGVIFFEMLAGHLPFPASEPMELIHSHIAKQPLWLHELNKKIPIVVSNIVAKLLSKSAEDRYQSASGLKFDLDKCLEQWSKKRKIDEFTLAKKDRTNQLQISQKLYGREQEVSQLLNIFKRASQGKTEIVLVSGLSGVGKTALVNEIQETVFDQSGYFISGKFSSIKRNIPYDPIIQAFQSLIQQLLTESDDEIKIWQKNILAALGSNHQIIVDVIPKLELIVGQVSPVAQLTTQESEKRFNYIFQQFINVFTKKRHPLVLFFDDLQWADPASLKLIQLLVNQPESKYLLIIGSFREDEVNDLHPLNLTLNELKKSEVKVNQVFLGSLNSNSVNQLVADMLEFELDTVKSLSELIFRKTNGNPFFINQLLQTLYQRKLLCFNDERSCWTWKLEEINKIDITENVVSFLIKKINNLSTEAQKLLKIAACTGNSFELNLLSLVYKKPQEKVSNILIEVVQEGLILPTNSCSSLIQNYNQVELNTYYCFVHDKIQQAAYSLLTANQKKLFHLQIGRVMLNYTYKNNVEENLFEIVNQFNLGIELVTHQNEIGQLARFNLLAGKKAKVSTAYESACQYLEKAQEILSKNRDTWKNYYKLMFSLSLELSECKYLSGRFEEAEEIFNLVLQQSKTKLEMAKVYILKINLYTDKGNLKQAIDIGLEAVKLFKITLPPKNIKLAISREIEKIQTKIGDQHIKDLYNLPEATDKNAVAIMNIFMSLAASTYFINLDLWALLMLKMINLSLKYGNTEVSSFAYSAYGLLIGSAFGNYQAGYEFGQLALEVNKKFNNLALNSKIYFMFGAFINHWKNHVSSDFDYLKKSFNFGNETGDPSFSSYASNILVAEMYIKGDHLNNVFKESKLYSDYVNKVKNIHGIYFQIVLQQIILNLQGLTKNVFTWNTNKFNEKKYLDEITKLGLSNSIHFYYIAKIQTFFLFEDYFQAHQMAIESENMVKFSFGLLRVGEHYFYYSLTLLALYSSVNSKTQKSDWKLIVSHQEQLKKWADSCPQNFLHKYLLIAAEIARVSNKDLEAMDLYDQSIASARENEYTQNEAIANELAAKFYLTKGKAKIARLYMLDACYAYVKWGATAKVNDIKQKYSQLLETPPGTMLRGTNLPNDSIASEPLALDLFTVIKASQTLFGEIVLDKLLEKLMKTLIENAGAQKGYLILPLLEKSETEVHWVIEAVGSVDADGVTFLQSIPINSVPTCQTSLVSSAIVNYVARSHENVVLNDAAHEGQFTRTPYIIATQPKSILCAPLLHQGKLSGILYLENNLTTGAFTPERVEILRILSAQAAISIENSRLYEQLEDYNRTLEQKVYSRTQELQEKNEELANTLQKLKTTQAQIIAQEKLASLGALAAGIAHEIKNPLNFVNNFAELSVELSQELLEEIENQKERLDLKSKAYIEEILSDISQNAQKINDHGKRADNIVRGMLMLSREQSGKRQLTDIHALLEESVNLAYHGMRVKDRSFKVVVEADYDDELDQLNIVPQDLSRAFINIINNACYAANEKKKEGGKEFLPTLSISTKDLNERVEIRIRDNGNGIPQEMFDKVFNPFFTTKTTWEGTGLGLSISHDIIVQRHQGEIKVESQLGYYTEFIINLPKNSHNKNSISEQT